MKNMKNKLKDITEFMNEAKGAWQIASNGDPLMFRFSGKSWPQVAYSEKDKLIYARNDNGPRPSASVSTDDLTVDGLTTLLRNNIDGVQPGKDIIAEFIKRIKK